MSLFPYTDRNHFQYGYRDPQTLETRWLEPRLSDNEEFIARYGRAQSRANSWREANLMAADKILSVALQKNLVPTLLLSGGLDSEIVLVAFLEALARRSPQDRPRVRAASFALRDDANRHDLEYIEKFRARPQVSEKLSEFEIDFKTYEIDVKAYWESPEFLRLADETKIVSPIVLSQVHLCEKIFEDRANALPVIGQGEIHLVRDDDLTADYTPKPWSIVETENLCGLFRFFIARDLPAVPGFFQYLPEQFDTQLRLNPVIHELISHRRFGKLGTRTSKPEILAHDYPELERRPKYTGFEKLPEFHDRWRALLGARFPSSEAKWKRGVFDLARDVRFGSTDIVTAGDWQFAWKKDGEPAKSIRGSEDDIFASAWPNSANPTSSGSIGDDFVAALRKWASQSGATTYLHDGSLFARLLETLGVFSEKAPHLAPDLSADLASQVARLALQTQIYDAEGLAWLVWIHSLAQSTRVLPLLHSRIVNAEYDRDLGATLSRPRFVAVEFERLALLTNALKESFKFSVIQPWMSRSLTECLVLATKKSGWPSLDEPGVSNHEFWLKTLEGLLKEHGETREQKELGENAARKFQSLLRNVERAMISCALPESRYLTTSRSVFEERKRASTVDPTALPEALPKIAESFLQRDSLQVISTERWLAQAKHRVPDFTYGGNLFYQQRLEGFTKFNEDLRASLALIHDEDEVAWAHVCALTLPPHGRLRIRGVTVRKDLERQGFATKLIKEITLALREHRPSGYTAIDVYAAPEALKAFRSAGFRDDVSRVSRAEEAVDPATGRLIALDRELTPLTFSLISP